MNLAELTQGLLATVLASIVVGGLGSLFISSRGLRRSIVSDRQVQEALAQAGSSTRIAPELEREMEWKAAVLVARSRFPMVSMTEVIAYVFSIAATLVMPWYIDQLGGGLERQIPAAVLATLFGFFPAFLAAPRVLTRLVRRFEFVHRFRGDGLAGARAGDWHTREARTQAEMTLGMLGLLLAFAQLICVLLVFEYTQHVGPTLASLAAWVALDALSMLFMTHSWRPLTALTSKGIWNQINEVAPGSEKPAGEAGEAGVPSEVNMSPIAARTAVSDTQPAAWTCGLGLWVSGSGSGSGSRFEEDLHRPGSAGLYRPQGHLNQISAKPARPVLGSR